jgi:hypothetical protein
LGSTISARVPGNAKADWGASNNPSVSFWKGLFSRIPSGFRFVFRAPEEITTAVFPKHLCYGARAGQGNPLFLDPTAFLAHFLKPLEHYA